MRGLGLRVEGFSICCLTAVGLIASTAVAEVRVEPDVAEPGSIEAIISATSDARFVSPWVAYVPEAEAVPSPSDYLGRIVGAPGELTRSSESYGYLEALAKASPRVHLEEIGRTEEGRPILLVAVADEQGVRELPQLKAATATLADPRQVSSEEAEAIIAGARPFFYINAGLHADETSSAEAVLELVYRLAVSEQPMVQQIRRNLVVLVNPIANPDGRDKMVDWFYRYLKGKTDYGALPRQSPPYWGRYVFVDANRDAHQQTQALTRAVFKMFFDYHPTVVHDLHEAIPLLQTWNGTGPYNPNLDPIVFAEFLEMSFHEVTAMTALGMPGVWTWDFGDGYGHHYLDSIGMNHNAIGRGYETFGNATGETVERELDSYATSRRWFRPVPAEERFTWSMRDSVNYTQTGLLAILDYSARQAPEMLRNFYRKGYNSWQRGLAESPHAFVIPDGQADPGRVAKMVNLLLRQGIEVGRATASMEVGGRTFPSRSFVVRLDQPYRNYAVDLLRPQEFPADAEHMPYDDISWALPMHYGVETIAVDDPGVLTIELEAVTEPVRAEGTVDGSGPVYLLRDVGQEAFLAARYRLADFEIEVAEEGFTVGGVGYPAGSWVLPAQAGLAEEVAEVARELGLDFESAATTPSAPRHRVEVPRIGVWVPWADTDSIGWIRYTLDSQGVPYTYLRDEDLRAGELRQSVDVILYGNVDLDLQAQIHGIEPVSGPMAFAATPEFPSLGQPIASDDITGGIGWSGLAALERFVEEGGVLLTLGNGSTLALDGGLIRFVRRSGETGIVTPGAELRARFLQPRHPLAYGYGETTTVFRANLPVYDLPRRWVRMAYCTSCLDGPVDMKSVVMEWGGMPKVRTDGGAAIRPPIVVSGGGKREDELAGSPAILAVPRGKGTIVAYNFNPMHRDLNHSDHRLLWNGVLNWQYLRPVQ
jgi:hypothetical protein